MSDYKKKIPVRAVSTAAVIIFAIAVLFFSGRSKKADSRPQTESGKQRILITATFYPLYIMLMNITENVPGVTLSMLAPPETGCLHDYQLTTKDMKTISDCTILVANGAGMEDFIDKALAEKKGSMIVAADGYDLIDGNPHVWVSPEGAQYEVQTIMNGLVKLDPDYAEIYKKNGLTYILKIKELSSRMHAVLDKYAGSAIITFHEAFPYFAAEFNLNPVAVIEREAGTSPSAKELAELVTIIKKQQERHVQVSVFAEKQYSSSAAEVIAAETGLTVYELDPAVTGPIDKDAYIKAMDTNTPILQKALASSGGIK